MVPPSAISNLVVGWILTISWFRDPFCYPQTHITDVYTRVWDNALDTECQMTSTYALLSRLQGPTVHEHTECPQHRIMALMCCDLTILALSTSSDLTGSTYNHSAVSGTTHLPNLIPICRSAAEICACAPRTKFRIGSRFRLICTSGSGFDHVAASRNHGAWA